MNRSIRFALVMVRIESLRSYRFGWISSNKWKRYDEWKPIGRTTGVSEAFSLRSTGRTLSSGNTSRRDKIRFVPPTELHAVKKECILNQAAKGGSHLSTNFAEIVEEVKTLSIQEKQDLHQLIESYLIEARRDEICDAYALSRSELDQGKLEFSGDTDELKGMLLND
jgi:hypothetical protein